MQRETLTTPVAEPRLRPALHPTPVTLRTGPSQSLITEALVLTWCSRGVEDREDQCPQKEDAPALGAGTAANSKSRKTP